MIVDNQYPQLSLLFELNDVIDIHDISSYISSMFDVFKIDERDSKCCICVEGQSYDLYISQNKNRVRIFVSVVNIEPNIFPHIIGTLLLFSACIRNRYNVKKFSLETDEGAASFILGSQIDPSCHIIF